MDPGYKATDTASPFDLTKRVRVDITPKLFDQGSVMKVGTYGIRYTVSDEGGNTVVGKRQITVVDGTPPVITIQGDAEVEHEGGTEYTDEGATAVDACDGVVKVTVADGHVTNVQGNIRNVGDYDIVYSSRDSNGNVQRATRSVKVVDTTKPLITRKGQPTVVIEATPDGVYTDAGATAHDRVDGDITKLIKTINTVDVQQPAEYTVTYNVVDQAGIGAHEVTRRVVIQDTIDPEVVLEGGDMDVEGSTPYVEPGYSATDTLLGNLTDQVTIEYTEVRGGNTGSAGNRTEVFAGGVDEYAPAGTVYYIDYTVKDIVNNTAVVRRVVTIIDTTRPVVYLAEPVDDMAVEAMTSYTEPGYHANDTLDGTRREPFNFTPMGVNSISPAHLHVRLMWGVRVDALANVRKIPTRKNIPLFLVGRRRHGFGGHHGP